MVRSRPPYTIKRVLGKLRTETRPPHRERQRPPALPTPDQDQRLDGDSCGTSGGEFVPKPVQGIECQYRGDEAARKVGRNGER
jgi:hypothetical protein